VIKKDDDDVPKEKSVRAEDLIVKEVKAVGGMTWTDLKAFLNFTIGGYGIISWFLFASLAACSQLASSYFIAYWTEQPLKEQQDMKYPVLWSAIIFLFILFSFLRGLIIFIIFVYGNTNMHNKMVEKILRAKI